MPVIIPTSTELANYRFTVELEGSVFGFDFAFNDRDRSWFFTLSREDGTVLRSGIKVVTNFPLLRTITAEGRPLGEIMAIDTTGEDLRAGLEDLGDQVSLVYFESSEVP